MTIEPMRTTGKRKIEMTTAEWIGRLLMPVSTFPSELKEGCGEILKLREEKEIASAVAWLEQRKIQALVDVTRDDLIIFKKKDFNKDFEDVQEREKT